MNKYSLLDFNHIAIIQTAFLGDVTLSLYLAQAIRNYHKTANITFVTTPIGSSVASVSNAIDNIITYDKKGLQKGLNGLKRISNLLIERKIDCIIAPHRSFRTTLLTFLSKPIFSVGFNRNALSIIYSKRIKYYKHYHEIDRNLSLLKAFNDQNLFPQQNIEIDLDIHPADKTFIENKLNFFDINSNDYIIAIAPGSVWNTKRWLEEHFIELIKKLNQRNFKSILLGSQEDYDLCKRISDNSGGINLAGELTIPQVIHLLSKTKLLVTNDSAPTHLAGLVNCPTLTIYGPTSPIFGFYPRGKFDKSIELENLKCKPCSIHGGKECPIKSHSCMKDLKPDFVFENALEILKNTNVLT
ncbi:MAG: glycosyltransferase family 9 protein [Candidatus Kapabacteria bacterium]|nr:glycosyltransferase family 9 protein [Candidatus Kapabacteria bacterium]